MTSVSKRLTRFADTIQGRLIFLVSGALMASCLLMMLTSVLAAYHAERQRIVAEIQYLAEAIEQAAAANLPKHHFLTFETFLEQLELKDSVVDLRVRDWHRKLLLDGNPATSRYLDAETPGPAETQVFVTGQPRLEWLTEGRLEILFRIDGDLDRPFGVTRLTIFEPQFWSHVTSIAARNAVALLAALTLVLPIALIVCGRVTRPLRTIALATRRLMVNADAEMPTCGPREMRFLARSLIRMARRLGRDVAKIHDLAMLDPVTGLANRVSFRLQTERALERMGSDGRSCAAVLFIDLDRFKNVNDSFGHDIGDRVLALVAQRLARRLRRTDQIEGSEGVLARLGGDEFTILLTEMAHPDDARLVAQRVLDALANPFEIAGHKIFVGASIGIALIPDNGSDFGTLMKNADVAMYHAKETGRNRYQMFSQARSQLVAERLEMEHEIREGLGRDQFFVAYQPKVDCRTGQPLGVEALARWLHPLKGLVSPGRFIPVAEETGQIAAIGHLVLEKACAQAAEWAKAGHTLDLAVNVSLRQFEEPDFPERVLDVLHRHNLPPERLELEITESVAMHDTQRIARTVEPLRRMGVRFAIDDFGTGYSCLSSLTQMPFDSFKIDRSFVHGMVEDPNARIIIRTILAMARSLNFSTVAEGVETAEQARFLADHGCTQAQGYLFGRPMDPDSVLHWLAEQQRAPLVPALA